jgi:threonine dehydratase
MHTRLRKVPGGAPLAAMLQERRLLANKSVAVGLSGKNIERTRFLEVLGGGTPSTDRLGQNPGMRSSR